MPFMNNIDILKIKLDQLASRKEEIRRVAKFKERTLVVDYSYRDVIIGMDVDAESSGNLAIFPRNDLAKFFLENWLNFDFNEFPRCAIYVSGTETSISSRLVKPVNANKEFIEILEDFFCILNYGLDDFFFTHPVEFNSFIFLNQLKYIEKTVQTIHASNSLVQVADFFRGKVLSMRETLDCIYEKQCSLARFGDGEFKLLARLGHKIIYQENSFELNNQLKEVLASPSDGLIVGIPPLLFENNFWKSFWTDNWSLIGYNFMLDSYANSMVTRPEFFRIFGLDGVSLWRRIWANKRVCFITGNRSRFNAEHLIFNGIVDARFIYSKPANAFSDLEHIKSEVVKLKGVDIYLIALGPAGTILAKQMHLMGYWALDIGHLNNSYDHVIEGAVTPESLRFQ